MAMAVTSTLVLGACVGAIGQAEFDDEVRARGGGLDGGLVADAVDAIEDDLDVDGVHLRAVDVRPGLVTLQVQVPTDPDELDTYQFGSSGRYGIRGLSDPTPVARGPGEPPLESQLFAPDTAGFERFDAMVAEALDAAEVDGGYAERASIIRTGAGGGPVTAVTVTNERRTAVATFAPDGTMLEVVDR